MNIGVKENTVQILFIGALVVLVGVVSFFKWPAEVTGATTRVPDCVVPVVGMVIQQNVVFCTGTYALPQGISVEQDGITVDCNYAVLQGEGKGAGITLDSNYVTVKDCTFKGYQEGVADHGRGNQLINVDITSFPRVS